MEFVLVRHLPTEIAAGVCYGRLDVPMRPDPAALHALVAAIHTHRPARVWTSPAIRCCVVAEATGLSRRIDPRLLELDFGAWEGVAWDYVPRAALGIGAAK